MVAILGLGTVSHRQMANRAPIRMHHRSHETVVFGVASNPIPHNAILLHHAQRAVLNTDPGRIDVVVASSFLNCNPGCAGLLRNCRYARRAAR